MVSLLTLSLLYGHLLPFSSFGVYEDLGQLGQDEPASGRRWSHCSVSGRYLLEYIIGTEWVQVSGFGFGRERMLSLPTLSLLQGLLVPGSGLRDPGFGFRVSRFGVRVSGVQGYLAHTKTPLPRNLQQAYSLGVLAVLEGQAFSYEQGTPAGFRLSGFGFWVSDFGCRISGVGCRV